MEAKIRNEEKKYILSKQPLALHEVVKFGWKYKKIESFGAFDITDALKIILNRVLLADAGVLKKLENLDDKAFSDNPHRKRRYVSKDQETLYLQKDEQFTKKHSIELYGYWFVTNIGYKELSTVFEMVCSAADIDGQVKQGFKAIGDL